MDVLSCNTLQMNEKEVWVHLLAYNLTRLLMAQAAMSTRTGAKCIHYVLHNIFHDLIHRPDCVSYSIEAAIE